MIDKPLVEYLQWDLNELAISEIDSHDEFVIGSLLSLIIADNS